jgi:hypothetical protein
MPRNNYAAAKAAYEVWRGAFGTRVDLPWENLSGSRADAWMLIALAAIEAATAEVD